MATASPTKLKTGEWGARCAPETKAGDEIVVSTKSGKSWKARVTRVVASFSDATLCEIVSLDPKRPRSRGRWTGCSCGSREDEYGTLIPSDSNCSSCEYDG